MQLEKFYGDIVTPDGGGCIAYAARIGGAAFTAVVAATLHWNGDATMPALQQRTMRGRLPTIGTDGVTWRCPSLGVTGVWSGRDAAPAEHTLWQETGGALCWHAFAPRADVRLALHNETIVGLGYAERLTLNFPPWRLPIDALRWGRFVSASHSVIWIGWEHDAPRRWLWHNGVAAAGFTLGHDTITWDGHQLHLGERRELRAGRLADTVLARWPAVGRLVPRQISHLNEKKWCAAATLTDQHGDTSHGWVIDEHVTFR